MKIELTKPLLRFLIQRGYRYCLAGTSQLPIVSAKIVITLKPVRKTPFAIRLPEGFTEYYLINEEPARLAKGVDGTVTMVEIDYPTIVAYLGSTLKVVKWKGNA